MYWDSAFCCNVSSAVLRNMPRIMAHPLVESINIEDEKLGSNWPTLCAFQFGKVHILAVLGYICAVEIASDPIGF